MEIDANVYNLLNILLQVVLWSLIISAPAIILTIEMYAYERYKKWKDTEVKEKEKIILGRANKIVSQDEELQRQHDNKLRLDLDVELLEKRLKAQREELGITEEPEVEELEEKTDLKTLKRVELLALAKERNLTMYSKKNKQQLIKMLEG
jgi:hypothetical protein